MEVNDVSLVLACRSPHELAKFYAFAMKAEACQGENFDHWFVDHPKGVRIQFYKPSRNQTLPMQGKGCSLCLNGYPSDNPLSEIQEWCLSLVSQGATFLEKARLEFFGAELWMQDPEGNNFLLLIPLTKGFGS